MAETAPLRHDDPERLGGYRLLGRLGEGGQGIVFLAEPDNDNAPVGPDAPDAPVAVKLLHTRLNANTRARTNFARELASARQVDPFCTARILAADLEGDIPYIVSEYIDGPSLQTTVESAGPRTGTALNRLAIGTATALTAIHRAGVVHRDFKPGNVLLGPDGPRVIDFGVARVAGPQLSATTQVVGTPAYMAPEQVSGGRPGMAADLFAWAGTIAYAASAQPPFGHDYIPAVINRILHQEPDLNGLGDTLLADLVRACLNKDPDLRPTARAVLLRLLGHEDPTPGPTTKKPAIDNPPTPSTSRPTPRKTATAPPNAAPSADAAPSGAASSGAAVSGAASSGAAVSGAASSGDAPADAVPSGAASSDVVPAGAAMSDDWASDADAAAASERAASSAGARAARTTRAATSDPGVSNASTSTDGGGAAHTTAVLDDPVDPASFVRDASGDPDTTRVVLEEADSLGMSAVLEQGAAAAAPPRARSRALLWSVLSAVLAGALTAAVIVFGFWSQFGASGGGPSKDPARSPSVSEAPTAAGVVTWLHGRLGLRLKEGWKVADRGESAKYVVTGGNCDGRAAGCHGFLVLGPTAVAQGVGLGPYDGRSPYRPSADLGPCRAEGQRRLSAGTAPVAGRTASFRSWKVRCARDGGTGTAAGYTQREWFLPQSQILIVAWWDDVHPEDVLAAAQWRR